MRVALFMDAPRIGGAERYFADLAGGLAEIGHQVHVVTPDGVLLPYVRDRVGDCVRIHPIGARPDYDGRVAMDLTRALRPMAEVRSALRAIQPDVVHLSNGGFPGAHTCRAAALVAPRPRVMTVNCRAQERRQLAHAPHDRLIWRSLDRVIVPARATAESLIELRSAPPQLLRVVPYGIAPPQPDEREVERLRADLAPGGELVVGMVAAPSSAEDIVNKGHAVLLEALGLADRQDVRAVVVGHDPGPEWRARAEALGLADRVVLRPGFHDAAPYMGAFDVLAVPSTRNEALPLVILEAMASGTPVLGSRLSGIVEAIVDGESGRTFDPGDAPALAALISALASDREQLARMAAGARARWRDRFELGRMVAETVAVYEECARTARRGVARDSTARPPAVPEQLPVSRDGG